MKRIIIAIAISASIASAYGWSLVECRYEHLNGYGSGYMGIYEKDGQYMTMWFKRWCPSYL
jgi:uncharacterized protein (DUF697 family)